MRVVIVDDEPIARQVLRQELESIPNVEIAAEAQDGIEAIDVITRLQPELVFLDLEMPGLMGLDVLQHLETARAPVVVIVTAYDQHAIQAFEAGAIDYLLKPVRRERLVQSVERAGRVLGQAGQAARRLQQLQSLNIERRSAGKIPGKLGDEYFLLSLQEIFAFQAEGDLTWIITQKQRYLATQNLTALESRLTPSVFQRIHRNALVNTNHIRKMSALSSQRWLVTLANGQEFVVSKRQAKNIRPLLTF